jgi:hypothetical protein
MQATTPSDRRYAGEGPAQALRAHGGRFPAIVDALRDAPRTAILPPLRSAPRSAAIRTPASAAPPGAHRLAQALRDGNAAVVLDAPAAASPQDARRRRQLHPKTLQHAILSETGMRTTRDHGRRCTYRSTTTLTGRTGARCCWRCAPIGRRRSCRF